MKLLLIFLISLSLHAVGPGTSGGNPSAVIASIDKEYLFQMNWPSDVYVGQIEDLYTFAGLVSTIKVRQTPFDDNVCPASNAFKTVCIKALPGSRIIHFVFSDLKTYKVEIETKNDESIILQDITEILQLTFMEN